jgi:DGQHR domain-containing protein
MIRGGKMPPSGIPLPAIRGRQGDREYFIVSVPNAIYLDFFTPLMDPEEPKEERAQRNLDTKRPKVIGEYILKNRSDYVLPTVVYAVEDGYTFTPDSEGSSTGVLLIPEGTNLRCLDGQHRRAGLAYAKGEDSEILEDFSSVLIYVEPDIQRRRQMFSDMNSTTVKVGKAVNISFDSRDPFARASVRLSQDHPRFGGRFQDHTGRVTPNSELWFALSAIYFSLQHLYSGPSGRIRDYDQFKEDDLVANGTQFLDLLWEFRPEFSDVATNKVSAEEMRKQSILFWGVGIRALASAIYLCQDKANRYGSLHEYGSAIRAIDFSPSNPRWAEVGFILPGKTTPIDRYKPRQDAAEEIAELISKDK